MKKSHVRLCASMVSVSLALLPPAISRAEDIDLFVGSTALDAASRPNVLFIIDNSANWSAASQHWAGGMKQGQSELRALRTVIGEADSTLNAGLMLFTAGSGDAKNGGYVRFAMRQMTSANKDAFRELIGDASCATGANSLNGTPNCIFKNYDTAAEKVGTSVSDYSAAMFEAFKYFGGYTSPANADNDVAGSPVDASHFGAIRYAGNPDSKSDPAAFAPTSQRSTYNPAVSATGSCAKNYVIFIGNGFPSGDAPSTLLSGVGGETSQLAMPQFSTTTSTQNTTLTGAACGTGNNEPQRISDCSANIPQSLKDANPADTYTCVTGTGVVDTAVCGTNPNARKYDVRASKTVISVTTTGQYVVPSSSTARYADEWAKFLASTDVSAALGRQSVKTYTIDVFKDQQDVNQTALLFNMAKVGGGQYYQASSEDDVLKALRDALIQIQADNSVFSAAALPVSATNRAQNENQVFFGMFRPDASARPRWYGNLKRYQIGVTTLGDLYTADKDGENAISAATGFFTACATSYWTSDSGTYWNFGGMSPGQCTTSSTSLYSDLPDGPQVEKGGAAEVVRRGNDPSAIAPFTVNRTMYTCSNTTDCPTTAPAAHMVPFSTANVSAAAVGASDSTRHQLIVDYTLGKDVNEENVNSNLTEPRPSIHGDIVHARPQAVNYGGSTGIVVYYGANDGPFRAVRSSDGKELWSFIAPEHHSRLKRLADNSPIIKYPGVTDATAAPKDYFFDGTPGLYQTIDNSKVWIFPTMRRGGRMIYAFDVTSPTAPVLKWRVGCPNAGNDTGCTEDYADIGQTWSFPNVARIKGYNSGADPVIVIGGGYDPCEDADTSTPSCGGAKGRKVYVINADTGERLASFETDRSVAADVALMDRDLDGLVDHAYVADTGGNVYRVDFVDPANVSARAAGDWTIQKVATTASNTGRKFLFAPSVLLGQNKAYIAIGSGDRERPLASNYPYLENIQNRFYVFVDAFALSSDPLNLDGETLVDNTSGSTCITPNSSAQGWRMELGSGRGEQTVTSALIAGGRVVFNTHRALEASSTQCSANLGEAVGYNVGLLCGDKYKVVYSAVGLPISPVQGTVTLSNSKVQTFVIGGVTDPNAKTPFSPGKVKPAITQKRSRVYWYRHGDK